MGRTRSAAVNSDDIGCPGAGLSLFVFAHPRSSVDGAYSPVPALPLYDAATAVLQAVPTTAESG
jgi:hypothetical protein